MFKRSSELEVRGSLQPVSSSSGQKPVKDLRALCHAPLVSVLCSTESNANSDGAWDISVVQTSEKQTPQRAFSLNSMKIYLGLIFFFFPKCKIFLKIGDGSPKLWNILKLQRNARWCLLSHRYVHGSRHSLSNSLPWCFRFTQNWVAMS